MLVNVHSRPVWTTIPVRLEPGADVLNGLSFYRKREVKGIQFYSSPMDQMIAEMDPASYWRILQAEAVGIGHSDIDFNLGVAGNVLNCWCLRGLQNKSSADLDPNINNSFVSVYIAAGSKERPTDTLLRNILDARWLVLSRYPEVKEVNWDNVENPWLREIFKKKEFWNGRLLKQLRSEPNFVDPLPTGELIPGHRSVHVQALQELLAFWGYYRIRVDGRYNIQTQDAVIELQADLKDGLEYYYGLDGHYTDHLHKSWLRYIETVA